MRAVIWGLKLVSREADSKPSMNVDDVTVDLCCSAYLERSSARRWPWAEVAGLDVSRITTHSPEPEMPPDQGEPCGSVLDAESIERQLALGNRSAAVIRDNLEVDRPVE